MAGVAAPLRLQVAIRCEVVPRREAGHIQAAKLLRRPPVAIQWAEEREAANPLAACEAAAASTAGSLLAAAALAAAAAAAAAVVAVVVAVAVLQRVAAGGPIAQRRFRNDNSTSSLLER